MTHIPTKWAEHDDRLFITLAVTSVSDVKVDFESKKINISLKGITANAPEPREIHTEMPLFMEIEPSNSGYNVGGMGIEIYATKKQKGYWKKLLDLPPKEVKSWLSVDWNKWKDENDVEEFENNDNMASMFGGGGAGMEDILKMNDMPGEEDSDDDMEEEDGDYEVPQNDDDTTKE